MKQHIDPDQLMELSDDQKKRLLEWWDPQYMDLVYSADADATINVCGNIELDGKPVEYEAIHNHKHYKNCLPLLTIGQMMQIIRDFKRHDINFSELIWTIEPCEVLWGATKKVLNSDPTE